MGSPDFPLKNPWQSFLPNNVGAFLAKISPSVANFSGNFSANPNPIALAAGSTLGRTTLSWTAPGSISVKITAGGTLFAENLPANGSLDTGNTVSDHQEFTFGGYHDRSRRLATLTEHVVALTCDVQYGRWIVTAAKGNGVCLFNASQQRNRRHAALSELDRQQWDASSRIDAQQCDGRD